MRIDQGINIDATWIGLIAVSDSDTGNSWKTFSVSDLVITPTIVNPPVSIGGQNNPLKKDSEYRIVIKSSQTNNVILDFKLSTITNQAGWVNTYAGLIQAHADIAGWLGAPASGSVAITSLPTSTPTSASSSAADSHRTFGLTETAVSIKGSAGNLYGYNIINTNPYPVYVKFCDQVTGSFVLGTTPVVKTVRVPANGGQVYQDPSSVQMHFSTAITVYAVRGAADTNTTAVTANKVIFEAQYK